MAHGWSFPRTANYAPPDLDTRYLPPDPAPVCVRATPNVDRWVSSSPFSVAEISIAGAWIRTAWWFLHGLPVRGRTELGRGTGPVNRRRRRAATKRPKRNKRNPRCDFANGICSDVRHHLSRPIHWSIQLGTHVTFSYFRVRSRNFCRKSVRFSAHPVIRFPPGLDFDFRDIETSESDRTGNDTSTPPPLNSQVSTSIFPSGNILGTF